MNVPIKRIGKFLHCQKEQVHLQMWTSWFITKNNFLTVKEIRKTYSMIDGPTVYKKYYIDSSEKYSKLYNVRYVKL